MLERQATTTSPENNYRRELRVIPAGNTPATYASQAEWLVNDPPNNSTTQTNACIYAFGGGSYRYGLFVNRQAIANSGALASAIPFSFAAGTYRLTYVGELNNQTNPSVVGPISDVNYPDGGSGTFNRIRFRVGTLAEMQTAFGTVNNGSIPSPLPGPSGDRWRLELQTAPASSTSPQYFTRFARRKDLTPDRYINAYDTDESPAVRKFEKVSGIIAENGEFLVAEDGQTFEVE